MSTPMCAPGSVSVEVVTAEEGEILDLGPIKIRVIEDGSHTGIPVPTFSELCTNWLQTTGSVQ